MGLAVEDEGGREAEGEAEENAEENALGKAIRGATVGSGGEGREGMLLNAAPTRGMATSRGMGEITA